MHCRKWQSSWVREQSQQKQMAGGGLDPEKKSDGRVVYFQIKCAKGIDMSQSGVLVKLSVAIVISLLTPPPHTHFSSQWRSKVAHISILSPPFYPHNSTITVCRPFLK